jgi:hypothetical protein
MIDASAITVDQLNADPYPVYDDLRRLAPNVYVPQIDEWLVTSSDNCRAIGALKDSVQLAPGHAVDGSKPSITGVNLAIGNMNWFSIRKNFPRF